MQILTKKMVTTGYNLTTIRPYQLVANQTISFPDRSQDFFQMTRQINMPK